MRALKKKPIQIYIESKQDKAIEALSKAKGVSKAEVIRISLDKYLKSLPIKEDPAMGIIGLGRSGKKDLAERHDRYLIRYSYAKKAK